MRFFFLCVYLYLCLFLCLYLYLYSFRTSSGVPSIGMKFIPHADLSCRRAERENAILGASESAMDDEIHYAGTSTKAKICIRKRISLLWTEKGGVRSGTKLAHDVLGRVPRGGGLSVRVGVEHDVPLRVSIAP